MSAEAVAELVAPAPTAEGRWITHRRARLLGWGAFAIGMVLRVLQLWLASRLGPDSVRFTLDIGVATFLAAILLGTASGLVGAIIVARRPGNIVGWLYVGTGLMQGVVSAGLAYAAVTMGTHPDDIGVFFAWLNGVVDYAIPFSFAALVLALFPDGHLVSRQWRVVIVLAAVGGVLRVLEVGFGEQSMLLIAGSVNPYRLGGALGQALETSSQLGIGSIVVEAAFVLGAASLADRYRRSSIDGRRQIRWLLLAGLFAVLATVPLVAATLAPPSMRSSLAGFDSLALLFAALTLAPIATLIAITRYRLYEIDRIVNRAVLYGSLTAILAGVFTAGIAFAQRLFIAFTHESSDAAIVLTTLVVATLYAPLRKRLEAFVDRRFKFEQPMFGPYRDELLRVLSVVDRQRAAQRLIDEAVRELGATGGAVLAADGTAVATAGTWPPPVVDRFAIPGGTKAMATIALGRRADGTGHDTGNLDELERIASMVVAAAR